MERIIVCESLQFSPCCCCFLRGMQCHPLEYFTEFSLACLSTEIFHIQHSLLQRVYCNFHASHARNPKKIQCNQEFKNYFPNYGQQITFWHVQNNLFGWFN